MSYPNSGDDQSGADPQYGGDQPYGGQQYGSGYGEQPYGGGQQYGGQAYGGGQPYGAPGPAPDNNLVWAILSTLLCCLPLGIVSIVKSTSVNSLWAQGRYPEAQKAAEDAKKFAMWGAIAGVVVAVLYFLFIVVMGVASTGY